MRKLLEIDHVTLAHICGGQDSGNQGDINVGVTIPTEAGGVQVGVQGSTKTWTTDYKTCVDGVRATPGAKPSDIRANCGLPPGAQP